jgi:hypothetical protein
MRRMTALALAGVLGMIGYGAAVPSPAQSISGELQQPIPPAWLQVFPMSNPLMRTYEPLPPSLKPRVLKIDVPKPAGLPLTSLTDLARSSPRGALPKKQREAQALPWVEDLKLNLRGDEYGTAIGTGLTTHLIGFNIRADAAASIPGLPNIGDRTAAWPRRPDVTLKASRGF